MKGIDAPLYLLKNTMIDIRPLSESCWFEMTTNEEKQNPLLGLDSIVVDDVSEMVEVRTPFLCCLILIFLKRIIENEYVI